MDVHCAKGFLLSVPLFSPSEGSKIRAYADFPFASILSLKPTYSTFEIPIDSAILANRTILHSFLPVEDQEVLTMSDLAYMPQFRIVV